MTNKNSNEMIIFSKQSNKRLSIIDRGKVWAKQFINNKKSPSVSPPQSTTNTISSSTSQTNIHCSPFSTSSISSSGVSSLSNSPYPSPTSFVDNNGLSTSTLIDSSSTASNYYYRNSCSNSSDNSSCSNTYLISPVDESGYLVPISLLNKSDLISFNSENYNTFETMIDKQQQQQQSPINSNYIDEQQSLRDNSTNKKMNNQYKKQFSSIRLRNQENNEVVDKLRSNRRHSDLILTPPPPILLPPPPPLPPRLSDFNNKNNLLLNNLTTESTSANYYYKQTYHNLKLNNINSNNSENKFEDIRRNLNNNINRKYFATTTKLISFNSNTNCTSVSNNNNINNQKDSNKVNNNNSNSENKKADESIIYIDSIDIDESTNEKPETSTNNFNDNLKEIDEMSFLNTQIDELTNNMNKMCTPNNHRHSKLSFECNNNITIDDTKSSNHDYHIIDDIEQSVIQAPSSIEKYRNSSGSSSCMLGENCLNSDDSFEYIHLNEFINTNMSTIQRENCCLIEEENSYERSWENSTTFLIDKLLNNNFDRERDNMTNMLKNNLLISLNSNVNCNNNNYKFNTNNNNNNSCTHICNKATVFPMNNLAKMNNNQFIDTILKPPQKPPPPLPANAQPLNLQHHNSKDDNKHLLTLTKNIESDEVDFIFNENGTILAKTDSCSKNSINYSDSNNLIELEDINEVWFQPNISRETVQNILSTLEVGAFLIRFSNSCKECFALSIRVPYFANATGVAHYLITKNEHGFKLKGVDKEFKTLKSLVTHYSVMQEILPVTLNLNFTINNNLLPHLNNNNNNNKSNANTIASTYNNKSFISNNDNNINLVK